jgi:putative transposase
VQIIGTVASDREFHECADGSNLIAAENPFRQCFWSACISRLSYMGKLNQRKIQGIIREMDRGKSSSSIAAMQKMSQRRVQQLYKQYKNTGEIPVLQKRGRKKLELTANEESIILYAYEEYKVNALALEKVLDRHYKMHIPHNRIHRVLKTNNKAKNEPNKQKQRKWIRYERRHSLSLVHVDWHEHGNIQVIAYLDDASRKILAAGEFDSAFRSIWNNMG